VRDAMDAAAPLDEWCCCVRWNRVVPTPRRWCQVDGASCTTTVARKPDRRGEHEGNR